MIFQAGFAGRFSDVRKAWPVGLQHQRLEVQTVTDRFRRTLS